MNYLCTLSQARERNCHPWEIYFEGKLEAELVKANPNLPIYDYEDIANIYRKDKSRAIDVIKSMRRTHTDY